MKKEKSQIPVYEIIYDNEPEIAYLKTTGKSMKKYVPTDKGMDQIINELKKKLKKLGYDYHKSYFRIFDSKRVNNLLLYGSDRADQLEKRKFDKKEWELYPFRLYWDYFFTNKKQEFILYENGPLFKNATKAMMKKRMLRPVYSMPPDEDVVKYYKKIVKKYKKYKKNDGTKYHQFYMNLLRVKQEYSKGEKAWQPEFMLTEKLAMKRFKLMRDDVTFAYKPKDGLGMWYILKDAIKKRVPNKVAALVVYKDLFPILPRMTKGGFYETALYTFKNNRLSHVIALFLLVPKEK